jgi:lipopolysaccharide heptosyltransferase II
VDVDAPALETCGGGRGGEMRQVDRILVVQTAFIGDVILTLPLVQALKDFFPEARIDLVVVPRVMDACRNHPAINQLIEYDKRGSERGLRGLRQKGRQLRQNGYDLAFVPHRSLRSALLVFLAGIPLRIGFKTSLGRFLFTRRIPYERESHEIERNLALLEGVGVHRPGHILPSVYPGDREKGRIDQLIATAGLGGTRQLAAIAPGTIWNTKRWLKERFAEVAESLAARKSGVVIIGGPEDAELGEEIKSLAHSPLVYNAAGSLSLLESAELIRRCSVLVSNDSAPMHLAVAVRTPVVAIFGATVPAFGFGPVGRRDAIVETRGLRCRPCSIHGGDRCPIGTFECMKNITSERVLARVTERMPEEEEG